MTKELSAKDIKKLSIEQLFAPAADTSSLLVACDRRDYSASRLARAVEDADAHLLNLNVTSLLADDAPDGTVVVALRVGRRDALAVARSIERYGYDVLDLDGDGSDDSYDTARRNADTLLRLLEM